ncbi:MAG TPA: DnaD domain protein [Bacillota bacterium]|nr:DnaD domain protein [Bacillota bacterium]
METMIKQLNKQTPEQFMEHLTKQSLEQSDKDVIKSFRNFRLSDEVVNVLLYYMFFMDHEATWNKLSRIAQFFSEHDIQTAAEAIDTVEKLKQYENQLDEQ